MNSTKTILIGKKKKNNFKKDNIDDFLNEYIPRFTEEDIPENDLLIDNSFELKQYTSKKKNIIRTRNKNNSMHRTYTNNTYCRKKRRIIRTRSNNNPRCRTYTNNTYC